MHDHAPTDVQEALRRRIAAMGSESRAKLLRVLNLPTAEPATLIGALYPHPEFRPMIAFLIELEEDLPTLGAVVEEFRRMEHEDYARSRARVSSP